MDPLNSDDELSDNGSWPEQFLLSLAMIGIAALCLLVTVTVLSRTFYRSIIPDDVLIVREIMVAAILLPLAVVTAQRAHISVTIFTSWVVGRAEHFLNAFGHLIGAIFAALLTYGGWRLLKSAWVSGEYFDGDIYLPMWIGYATFVGAALIFLIRLIVMVVVDLRNGFGPATDT